MKVAMTVALLSSLVGAWKVRVDAAKCSESETAWYEISGIGDFDVVPWHGLPWQGHVTKCDYFQAWDGGRWDCIGQNHNFDAKSATVLEGDCASFTFSKEGTQGYRQLFTDQCNDEINENWEGLRCWG